jgi:hypothetical protein
MIIATCLIQHLNLDQINTDSPDVTLTIGAVEIQVDLVSYLGEED